MDAGDPTAMLDFLRTSGRASERKVRLFACACGRRIWHLLGDDRSREAIEVAERFADGLATSLELATASEAANMALEAIDPGPTQPFRSEDYPVFHAAEVAASVADPEPYDDEGGDSIRAAAGGAAYAIGSAAGVEKPDPAEQQAQVVLLRDLFGANPHHPATVPTSWLTPTVIALAQAAYEERVAPDPSRPGWLVLDRQRLLILSDALEEAGCREDQLLDHLREAGGHALGCWVLDSLLGKS